MKRRITSLLCLMCLLLAALGTASADAAHYQITGVVVSSTTGQPVPHCHLTATAEREVGVAATGVVGGPVAARGGPAAGQRRFPNRGYPRATPPTPPTFDCDERGHFSIDLPSGGRWNLQASARGYQEAAYDQHEEFSAAVVLSESTPTIDLHFRLDPESAIVGYIRDEADEPVRNANVQLLIGAHTGPAGAMRYMVNNYAQTDDRGRYEFAGLQRGSYQIQLQVQPWYVIGGQQMGGGNRDLSVNPALDVVYPLTWYPGTVDPANAGILVLRAGEEREADVSLLPVPSFHLRIPAPPGGVGDPTSANRRFQPRYPQIAQLTANGGIVYGQTNLSSSANGDLDIGGLAPGTYQLTMQSAGQQAGAAEVSILHVAPGASRTLDLTTTTPEIPVTIETDAPEGTHFNITLTDLDSGRSTFVANGMPRRRAPSADDPAEKEHLSAQVPPGRYQVVLQGSGDFFLKQITAEGAEVTGRVVAIGGGSPKLMLHLGNGRGSVSGFVTVAGKPASGTMVLLIPTTMGDPAGLPIARRDESDTDGSFHITAILPGRYILLAIDHGWDVNWNDPVTLSRYLLGGVPLDLSNSGTHKQDVEAQSP